MRDCESIRASLGVWLDGELSASDAEMVRSHLERCAQCDGERRQLEKLHASLKSLVLSDAPRVSFEPFWREVQQRIAKKWSWREKVKAGSQAIFVRPGLAWAVPVVIVILLGVLSLDSFWRTAPQRNNFAAVESIDAHGRNVALLREDETKTTVIWLYQNQEGENESSGENGGAGPSF
jgi:anti-sigma factor RsiW